MAKKKNIRGRNDNEEVATKGDVRSAVDELAQATKAGFDEMQVFIEKNTRETRNYMDQRTMEMKGYMDQRTMEMKGYMDQRTMEMKGYMDQKTIETLDHFDAVAENIHQDVAGANKDEIGLIKDKQKVQEREIQELQKKVGIR